MLLYHKMTLANDDVKVDDLYQGHQIKRYLIHVIAY